MDDQRIRLGLQLTGTETVTAAAGAAGKLRDELGRFVGAAEGAERAMKQVGAAADRAGDAEKALSRDAELLAHNFEQLNTRSRFVEEENARLARSYDVVELAMMDVDRVQDKASATTVRTTRVTTSAGQSMGMMQQRTTAASYAFQDFMSTSGDLGQKLNSISNNIPGIIGGFGGLATAISVVSVAGIALYRNWDSVSALWEERNALPAVTDSAKAFDDSLKDVNRQIDAMREKGSLNNAEVLKLNELTKEQVRLEGELKAAQEYKALAQSHNEHSDESDKNRASAVGKTLDLMGGTDATLKRFVDEYMKYVDAEEGARETITQQFQAWLVAASKGDEKAIRTLSGYNFGESQMFGSSVARFNPQRKAEADQQKKVAGQDQAIDEGFEADAREAAAAKAKQDAAADRLNEAGRENERRWRTGESRQDDKEETAAEKKAKAELKAKVKGADKGAGDLFKQVTGNTSIDEEASALAAQYRGSGEGSPEQQEAALEKQVIDTLRRDYGLKPIDASRVGGRIARDAFAGVDQQLAVAQANLADAEGGKGEAIQNAFIALLQMTQEAAMRAKQQEQWWAQNAPRARNGRRTIN